MNVSYQYGDKKSKRLWIDTFLKTGYSEEMEYETGYCMSIEIGLNKGIHTYTKGIWCYHNQLHARRLPFEWEEAKQIYNIDFDQYLQGALEFAIEKGYCK